MQGQSSNHDRRPDDRMTFKTAGLMTMLQTRMLPKLDDNDQVFVAGGRRISGNSASPTQPSKPRILVTPKATNRVAANWWVQFEDTYTQRQFSRRLDDFSYRFDVTSILAMAAYVFCYVIFDCVYMSITTKPLYTGTGYGVRITIRLLSCLLLCGGAMLHWKKSSDRPRYTPWGTKWWYTRSNALVVDITIFFLALHAVNFFSGDIWSPTVQYRIFFEFTIALSMRPVEKLQAILCACILGIFIPLIWLLVTMHTPTDTCVDGIISVNWDPQVAMLPAVAIIWPFVIERICHYRLLFLALEFVQWRRLQMEELEALLQCGQEEYGVADMKAKRNSITQVGRETLYDDDIESTGAASDKNGVGDHSVNKYVVGEEHLPSPTSTTSESRYVSALEEVDHTTPAELGIAHIHRVLDQLDMPIEYQVLLRDAIAIMRKGPNIYEPNIIEQLSRVVRGGKKKRTTPHSKSKSKSPKKGMTPHHLVGPLGSEALKQSRRNMLVKTKTVIDMFDLNHSTEHLETLDIDTQEMVVSFSKTSFNVFDYEKNPKQAFVAAGILVLNDHYMFQTFRLDEMRVLRALQRLADIYNTPSNVPYHSQLHGVDVAQLAHLHLSALYKDGSKEGSPLDAVHRFSLIFGALVHDLGHPGVNNSFLTETSSPMALRFNDISVLEMFHVSSTFQVLAKPECDIFEQLDHDERSKIRSVMIDLILATDLADHFKSLKTIQTTLNIPSVDVMPYLKIGGTSNASMLGHYKLPLQMSGVEQSELSKLILKASDIGHPSRDMWVHQEWSRRASEEFWRQGDRERRLGLPVNPMNDRREQKGLAKGQMGFLSFLVAPTHLTLRVAIGRYKLQRLHDNLRNNYQYWEQMTITDQARAAARQQQASPVTSQAAAAAAAAAAAQAKSRAVVEEKSEIPALTPPRRSASPKRIFSVQRPPLPKLEEEEVERDEIF